MELWNHVNSSPLQNGSYSGIPKITQPIHELNNTLLDLASECICSSSQQL